MIKLLVDSAADIGPSQAKEYGVAVIPMMITFGETEYRDGIDLTPQDFYDKLVESDELPKTSQIPPFAFEEAYEELVGTEDELIVITISSKLSGTYANAVAAAERFGGRVRVVDSLNACIGERLLCEYALRLIKAGETLDGIVNKLEQKKSKIHLMALLGTLEYLKRGGRISSAVAFAGELISLKPVVGVVDGEVKLIGKALGSRKGNNLLNKLVARTKGIDFSMPLGTICSGSDKSILDKYVEDSAALWADGIKEIPKYLLGATIGTHVGPGVVGVAFFEKE